MRFEVVHVHQHAGERAVAPARPAVEFLAQAALEKAPVVEAGERVREAVNLQALVAYGIVEAHGRHRGHVLEQIGAGIRPEMRSLAAGLVQAADKLLA